jgi:tetratricopeptide (TPR) repeat protein
MARKRKKFNDPSQMDFLNELFNNSYSRKIEELMRFPIVPFTGLTAYTGVANSGTGKVSKGRGGSLAKILFGGGGGGGGGFGGRGSAGGGGGEWFSPVAEYLGGSGWQKNKDGDYEDATTEKTYWEKLFYDLGIISKRLGYAKAIEKMFKQFDAIKGFAKAHPKLAAAAASLFLAAKILKAMSKDREERMLSEKDMLGLGMDPRKMYATDPILKAHGGSWKSLATPLAAWNKMIGGLRSGDTAAAGEYSELVSKAGLHGISTLGSGKGGYATAEEMFARFFDKYQEYSAAGEHGKALQIKQLAGFDNAIADYARTRKGMTGRRAIAHFYSDNSNAARDKAKYAEERRDYGEGVEIAKHWLSAGWSGILDEFARIPKSIVELIESVKDLTEPIVAERKRQIKATQGTATPTSTSGESPEDKKLPHLAKGGIVKRRTKAIVGEGKEPEAILPVSRLRSFVGGSHLKGRGLGFANDDRRSFYTGHAWSARRLGGATGSGILASTSRINSLAGNRTSITVHKVEVRTNDAKGFVKSMEKEAQRRGAVAAMDTKRKA